MILFDFIVLCNVKVFLVVFVFRKVWIIIVYVIVLGLILREGSFMNIVFVVFIFFVFVKLWISVVYVFILGLELVLNIFLYIFKVWVWLWVFDNKLMSME